MRLPFLQEFIHQLENGVGSRFIRTALLILLTGTLWFLYDWRAFRNPSAQEAMDAAQVGRNLAEGKGFTTLCVRPFSMFLLKRHNQPPGGVARAAHANDPAQIKGPHPDLANPPVYPLMLAGLMKTLPFQFLSPNANPGLGGPSASARSQPDFLIALANQVLFLVLVALVFFLARRLFDEPVAWVSAVVLFGSELFWRFSVSGLSTMLLLVIFVGLLFVLTSLESAGRDPSPQAGGGFLPALLAGVILGLGALTRYSFGWLILPTLVFLAIAGGPRRGVLMVATLAAFAAVMAPWIARNYSVSGTPFGTAGYAMLESTFIYPENKLGRSLEPEFSHVILAPFWIKLAGNLRAIISGDLPRLGGSWLSAFFLPGLLVRFVNPATTRLRYFLLACVPVLCVVQALGRTQISEDSPEINGENLLVLLAPVVMVYGVSFFFQLLDQVEVPALVFRHLISAVFVLLCSIPLMLIFLPPKTRPVAYPPYLPAAIQTVAGLTKENELIMSDVPWAVAWYGHRQSVWLTLRAVPDKKDNNLHEDFFAIHDYQKAINVLYLTPATMDSRFLSQWIQPGELSWGSFILQTVLLKEEPPSFPLRKAPRDWLPYQLLLTDYDRTHRAKEAGADR